MFTFDLFCVIVVHISLWKSLMPHTRKSLDNAGIGERLAAKGRERQKKRPFDEEVYVGQSRNAEARSSSKPVARKKAATADNRINPDLLPSISYYPLTREGLAEYERHVNDSRGEEEPPFHYDVHNTVDKPHLFITTAAIINQDCVMTGQSIRRGTELCQYGGERVEYSKWSDEVSRDYFFELEEGPLLICGIDAKNRGNWARAVNGTEPDSANVGVRKEGNRIIYYALRTIQAGEQLLISYGESYSFKNKCFLRTEDNWRDSNALYDDYQAHYQTISHVSNRLVPHLKVRRGTDLQLFQPHAKKGHTFDGRQVVDLPILIRQGEHFLPQSKSENLTLLMASCIEGDLERLQNLIRNGAKTHLQASRSGNTPLHYLLLNQDLNDADKLAGFKALIGNKAPLDPKNRLDMGPMLAYIESSNFSARQVKSFLTRLIDDPCITENDFSVGRELLFNIYKAKKLTSDDKQALFQHLILDREVPIDAQDRSENTLLHLAVFNIDLSFAEFFIALDSERAFFEKINARDLCPVLSALAAGNIKMLELLLPQTELCDLDNWAYNHSTDPFSKAIQDLVDNQSITDDEQKSALLYTKEFMQNLHKKTTDKEAREALKILIDYLTANLEDNFVERSQNKGKSASKKGQALTPKVSEAAEPPSSMAYQTTKKAKPKKTTRSSQITRSAASTSICQNPYAKFYNEPTRAGKTTRKAKAGRPTRSHTY